MVDAVDMASDIQAEMIDIAVRAARNAILPGISGACDGCDWWMPRLVDGLCGFCRDGRARPPDWEPPPRPDPVVTHPPTEYPDMAPAPTKSVTVVVSGPVLEELKRLTADGTSYTKAGMVLFERALAGDPGDEQGLRALPADAEPLPLRRRIFSALDAVAELVAEALDTPGPTADDAAQAEAMAELARVREAADRDAASLRTALDAERQRADAATAKLDALRAALAA